MLFSLDFASLIASLEKRPLRKLNIARIILNVENAVDLLFKNSKSYQELSCFSKSLKTLRNLENYPEKTAWSIIGRLAGQTMLFDFGPRRKFVLDPSYEVMRIGLVNFCR